MFKSFKRLLSFMGPGGGEEGHSYLVTDDIDYDTASYNAGNSPIEKARQALRDMKAGRGVTVREELFGASAFPGIFGAPGGSIEFSLAPEDGVEAIRNWLKEAHAA